MVITKALTRLREFADWFAPLLFANPEDRFSRVDVLSNYAFNDFFLDLLAVALSEIWHLLVIRVHLFRKGLTVLAPVCLFLLGPY